MTQPTKFMSFARHQKLFNLYTNHTNDQLRRAARYLAAAKDESGTVREHLIVVEAIIENRK